MVSLNLGLSILTLLSFTIVYVFFTKFFWNPIVRAIKDREDSIKTGIEKTKQALQEAEQRRDEGENLLFEAHRESDRLIAEARRTAENIRADIIETAKMETQMIIEQARLQADYERNRILETLRKDICVLTMEATRRVLKRVVTPQENSRYIEETVSELVAK